MHYNILKIKSEQNYERSFHRVNLANSLRERAMRFEDIFGRKHSDDSQPDFKLWSILRSTEVRANHVIKEPTLGGSSCCSLASSRSLESRNVPRNKRNSER